MKGHIYLLHVYRCCIALHATFKLLFPIVYGTASNVVQGIKFHILLDMKVVELIVMSFNSQ